MPIKVKRDKKKGISQKLVWLTFAYCLLPFVSFAQCAMCRAALESTGDNSKVEAVNDGIVFLMAIPYIIVAGIGFVVYKMYYKKGK
jgi:heme/copper-type cytochrome/quinol oxidase subunit 2